MLSSSNLTLDQVQHSAEQATAHRPAMHSPIVIQDGAQNGLRQRRVRSMSAAVNMVFAVSLSSEGIKNK